MTLGEIAEKTGLTKRRLCYVLEHDFFGTGAKPSRWEKDAGRGNTRRFDGFEAFGISCVAMMLDAGLRRREIVRTMAQLRASSSDLKSNLLCQAFAGTGEAFLEIADRYYFRFLSQGAKSKARWRTIDRGDLRDRDYVPFVVLRFDVAAIREVLK